MHEGFKIILCWQRSYDNLFLYLLQKPIELAIMKKISASLRNIITLHSSRSLNAWLAEQQIEIPSKAKNFFDGLEQLIGSGQITIDLLTSGLAELEENSSKKILLFQTTKFKLIAQQKAELLKKIKKKFGNFDPDKNLIIGGANRSSTFNYCYWGNDELKIKMAEMHTDVTVDKEKGKFDLSDRRVVIVFTMNLNDGFTQIRFDKAGTKHTHKNTVGYSTELAYEEYYLQIFMELFADAELKEITMSQIAIHIHDNVKDKFRLTKGLNTITNGDKLQVSARSAKADIRDSDEYKRTMASPDRSWRTEDLTGYWIMTASEGELKQDLFMRMSRRESQVRVQRGCTAKELSYGLNEIKSIQGAL